ncbi:restriction endonuclease subunit S [Breoghania sp.]|uniref:restriction endonuclease subunit S n=1 Tax=Breoghania sp. TaxID=2065378 RepID=UPI002AA95A19|nr:restriction endonuclease subunit S [Breoghania sp.]
MSGLPKGWGEAELGLVVGKLTDGSHNPPKGQEAGLPMLSARNVDDGAINFDQFRWIDPDAFEAEDRRTRVTSGDILLTIVGAIGRSAVVNDGHPKFTLQRSVAVLGELNGLVPEFVSRYFRSPTFQNWLQDNAKGTAQKGVYLKKLATSAVPIPPLAEQKRIVVKLDALSARSARAREALDRIETLVKRYKQAVLSKAFSGELTKNDGWQLMPEGMVTSASKGQLPDSWQTRELAEISEIQSGLALGKKRKTDAELIELPYLRVANVQRGWLTLDEIKTVEVTENEAQKLYLKPGDVLMNEGGDRDKLGRGWVWNGEIEDCIHQNHVFRVRLHANALPPKFLSYYSNEFGQQHFFSQGKQTTNLASISKSKLSAMKVPVPPFPEAEEIVRRIESAFQKIDQLAAEAKRALELTDKLDEAILAKAFRGELVPQDPNDEPASVLLDRIKAERAAQPKPKRGRGKKA